jgi:NitT/TauT family transport system substrate-binding protein
VVLGAEKYGADMKTIRLVPLQGLSNLATAIAGGQVDAGVEVNTIALRLAAENKGHILAWVGDETPWQNTILFTSGRSADDRHATVEAFLRAYKRGARDYYDAFSGPDGKRRDGPTAEATLALIAKHLNQPAAQLKEGISFVDPELRLDVQDVQHQIAWFKAQNMLPAEADGMKMIDQRYVVPLATK